MADGRVQGGGPRRRAAFAAGAALLLASGLAVWTLADRTTIGPGLVVLIAVCTSAISLLVGYVLGFYGDRGGASGRAPR